MKNRNIVIGSSCLYPPPYPQKVWKNREKDYYNSIKSLQNLGEDLDFTIFDNSIRDLGEIKNVELRELLLEYCPDRSAYASFFKGYPELFSNNHDTGYENLIKQSAKDPYVINHNFVTILNLRRYFISAYWFYLCENMLSKEECDLLLISNREYSMVNMELVSNDSSIPIEDNIFSMSQSLFQDYVKYIEQDNSKREHKEKLWSFSKDKKYRIVEHAGLVRNDWDVIKQDFKINNLTFS